MRSHILTVDLRVPLTDEFDDGLRRTVERDLLRHIRIRDDDATIVDEVGDQAGLAGTVASGECHAFGAVHP